MWRSALLVLVAWAAGAGVLRATVIEAEVCPPLTAADARAAAVRSAEWMERAQYPDGTYLYEYDRDTDALSLEYNVVRHAGVTMSLYQFAAVGEPRFLPVADRGLGYMEANLLRGEGWAAFLDPGSERVALGANALLLAGLAQRRIATGDASRDGLMAEVAGFLVKLQRTDGSFLAEWDRATGAPVPGITSKYATGEAFWALALMHRLFPGGGWDVPSRLVATYLATARDDVEGFDFPPWADQWAAYGLAEMARWPVDDRQAVYARSLAERFGFLIRVESRRRTTWFSDLLHGRQARAAGLGTWVEGLGSLWALAGVDPRLADLKTDIGRRAICGAGMLASRQVAPGEDLGARPGVLLGAWFTEGKTRMDDQQHALSGLLLAERILEAPR